MNYAYSPALPGLATSKTYAAWPVWKDSARLPVKWSALGRKQAARYFQKARAFNRATKIAGRYGGVLGSSALLVLQSLIFDFLNYGSGRLDPSYAAIAQKTGLGRSTVAEALKRLKELRIINWVRRCFEYRDEGRFELRQETNAYAVLPPTHWIGFEDPDPPAPPPPHASVWGAVPPLPRPLDQAAEELEAGGSMAAVVGALEGDPTDRLAAALASLGRSIGEARS